MTRRGSKRHAAILALARDQSATDDLEIDDTARVSESDDNGCWVQAWLWVPFGDTALDKEGKASA